MSKGMWESGLPAEDGWYWLAFAYNEPHWGIPPEKWSIRLCEVALRPDGVFVDWNPYNPGSNDLHIYHHWTQAVTQPPSEPEFARVEAEG